MSRTKTILMWLMAANYCAAGFMHLLNPGFFVPLIPPGLPSPEWLNLLSGLAEIVLGVYLLEPRTRVFAAWGIIALLIAVFPANVYGALEYRFSSELSWFADFQLGRQTVKLLTGTNGNDVASDHMGWEFHDPNSTDNNDKIFFINSNK